MNYQIKNIEDYISRKEHDPRLENVLLKFFEAAEYPVTIDISDDKELIIIGRNIEVELRPSETYMTITLLSKKFEVDFHKSADLDAFLCSFEIAGENKPWICIDGSLKDFSAESKAFELLDFMEKAKKVISSKEYSYRNLIDKFQEILNISLSDIESLHVSLYNNSKEVSKILLYKSKTGLEAATINCGDHKIDVDYYNNVTYSRKNFDYVCNQESQSFSLKCSGDSITDVVELLSNANKEIVDFLHEIALFNVK